MTAKRCYPLQGESIVDGVDDSKVTLPYRVEGVTDRVEAENLMIATSPEIVFTATTPISFPLKRDTWEIDYLGNGVWQGSVTYGPDTLENLSGRLGEADATLTFEVSGETTHITQSLKTDGEYVRDGDTVTPYHGVIAPDGEGHVDGCDILAPRTTIGYTRFVPALMVGAGFVTALANCVGKINKTPWRGFAAGSVLFLGCTGAFRREKRDWEIRYQFGVSPNRFLLDIDGISVLQKRGWDYLWAMYEKVVEGSKHVVPKPLQVNSEVVYEEIDFNLLGL